MRMRIGGLLLAAVLLGTPAAVRAQVSNYEAPPVVFTGPLSHPRYEAGGLYTAFQFLYMFNNRPLGDQIVAIRGFLDSDGSITGTPNTFVGSGEPTLSTNQLRGPTQLQPGFNIAVGWRFENGVTTELSWWHLSEARYAATASLIPRGFRTGAQLENTFLFSPVTNFPPDFAGMPDNVFQGPGGQTPNPGATFGIWNAASLMQIQYTQRFDMFSVNSRIPIWETDCDRVYGTFGPRIVSFYDRFWWRTVSYNTLGEANPETIGIYSNTNSQHLYGAYLGCGYDRYFGSTPIGAFAGMIDINAGMYVSLVKGRMRYNLENRTIALTRARNLSALVPGGEARFSLAWYPWEAIQVQLGYDALVFFNTIASKQPIDFDMGSLDPEYNRGVTRYLHGLTFGISFVF